jgi:chemotaxis protein CheZ
MNAVIQPVMAGESAAPDAAAAAQTLSAVEIFQRVGELTRNLHDALRELNQNEGLTQAVHELPDARDRLNYIATLTGRAAERVLAGVERAKAQQERLNADAGRLGVRWEQLHMYGLTPEQSKALAGETREFFAALPARAAETDGELTDIMMAQDFHDLTGQVIQRVGKLVHSLEENLVKLLIDTAPVEKRREVHDDGLTGPVVNPAGRDDVVTNQGQVDDLLASLGF